MVSTCWVQTKLRDQSNVPRYLSYRGIDPEINLDKIHIIHSIEVCYYRGLVTLCQIEQIEDWLCTGIIEDVYSLSAALAALATIADYEDSAFIKGNGGKGVSAAEIQHKLLELSTNFTQDLEPTITEEINDHALG